MSIYYIKDIINEIKKYCNDKILISFLLTCKLSIVNIKNYKQEIHNQALERELNHCFTNKRVQLHDRLCSIHHNYRVIKLNQSLYAVKVDLYGNMIDNSVYTVIKKNDTIKIEKYKNRQVSVNYGIILYKDGPIATSKNSPYLKYKTVAIGVYNVRPEINMMVTVRSKRNYEKYEYYITDINGKTLVLSSINNHKDLTLIFFNVDNKWVTEKYTFVKFGGFILDIYRKVNIVNNLSF